MRDRTILRSVARPGLERHGRSPNIVSIFRLDDEPGRPYGQGAGRSLVQSPRCRPASGDRNGARHAGGWRPGQGCRPPQAGRNALCLVDAARHRRHGSDRVTWHDFDHPDQGKAGSRRRVRELGIVDR